MRAGPVCKYDSGGTYAAHESSYARSIFNFQKAYAVSRNEGVCGFVNLRSDVDPRRAYHRRRTARVIEEVCITGGTFVLFHLVAIYHIERRAPGHTSRQHRRAREQRRYHGAVGQPRLTRSMSRPYLSLYMYDRIYGFLEVRLVKRDARASECGYVCVRYVTNAGVRCGGVHESEELPLLMCWMRPMRSASP